MSLQVNGVTAFGKEGTGLNCHISENSTECKTAEEKAKVKTSNIEGFFWWFKLPLFIGQGSACSTAGTPGVASKKVAFLSLRGQRDKKQPKIDEKALPVADSEWGNIPHLEVASLKVVNLGKDILTLGDHAFNAQKCWLEVKPEKSDEISLTEWTDSKGLILAVQDDSHPDSMIGLLQFKRYAVSTSASAVK